MRCNLLMPVQYDGDRPDIGETGYASSDVEEDIQEALRKCRADNKTARPGAEDRDQLKAKRQRLAKRAELIKETLGSGRIVTDAIYFSKVSALHMDGNYRPAMDHIADQTPKVTDGRLDKHDEVDEATFWEVVMLHMKKKHTEGFIGMMATEIVDGLTQGTIEDVGEYAARTKYARTAAIKFMTVEKHSDREIKQFKVNFNTGWIKGLSLPGELPVMHSTAIKTSCPMDFKDVRSMAEAIEEHRRQDTREPARAPANAAQPQWSPANAAQTQWSPAWSPASTTYEEHRQQDTREPARAPANAAQPRWSPANSPYEEHRRQNTREPDGAPANAAKPQWSSTNSANTPSWADNTGAAPTTMGQPQAQTPGDAPAAAAVAKLTEMMKGMQEDNRKTNEDSRRAINSLRPRQGGKGGGKGGGNTTWERQ